jgi:hypothetical protein
MAGAKIMVAACVLACGAQANAASFHSQQILILGSALVGATGINDAGTIVGISSSGGYFGFVLQGSTLSVLSSAYPTAINRKGAVTGMTSTDTGFLWENGGFVQGVSFSLGSFNGQPLPPVLNQSAEIAYTYSNGTTQTAYAGRSGRFRALKGLSPQSAIVSSINKDGVIAGYERAMIQGQSHEVAFVGKHGLFNMLLPPSNTNVTGGFVNDGGQVAFTDGTQGYVYDAGTTTSFSVPAPSYNVQIQAINNKGRIVGTYTDTSQNPPVQHIFLYNGSAVSSFGNYGQADIVRVALNDHGTMVVSDTTSGQQMASYRVTCSGSGC